MVARITDLDLITATLAHFGVTAIKPRSILAKVSAAAGSVPSDEVDRALRHQLVVIETLIALGHDLPDRTSLDWVRCIYSPIWIAARNMAASDDTLSRYAA